MRTMKRVLMGCAGLLAICGSVLGAEQTGQGFKFENDTGWIWHIRPQPAGWMSMATRGLVMRLDELKDDRLLLTLAHSRRPPQMR